MALEVEERCLWEDKDTASDGVQGALTAMPGSHREWSWGWQGGGEASGSSERWIQRRRQCHEDTQRQSLGVKTARRPAGMWRRTRVG